MDGLQGGQRLRARDRRRAHPDRRRLGDRGVAHAAREVAARHRPRRRRHPPLPGHPRPPRPLHAGGDHPPRGRLARQPRPRRQADPRPDHTPRDLGEDPHVALLSAAGAPRHRPGVGRVHRGSTPDLSLWDYPDTWLDGDHADRRSATAPSTPCTRPATRRATTSSPTGPPGCSSPATTCCRRSPRRSASSRRSRRAAARRLHGLADQGARAARPALLPAHGPVAPSLARPRRRAARPPRGAARAVPSRRRRRGADGVRRRGRAALDPARAPLADLDVFNAALATLETRAHLELLVARGDADARRDATGSWSTRPDARIGRCRDAVLDELRPVDLEADAGVQPVSAGLRVQPHLAVADLGQRGVHQLAASPRPRAAGATTTRPIRRASPSSSTRRQPTSVVVLVQQHVAGGRLEVAAVEVGVGRRPARPRRPAGAAATASYAVRGSRSSKADREILIEQELHDLPEGPARPRARAAGSGRRGSGPGSST